MRQQAVPCHFGRAGGSTLEVPGEHHSPDGSRGPWTRLLERVGLRKPRTRGHHTRCPPRSAVLVPFVASRHFPRAFAMRRVSPVCCRRPILPSRIVQKWANRACTLRPCFVTPK